MEEGEVGRRANLVWGCHWYSLLGKVVGGDLGREDWSNRTAGWVEAQGQGRTNSRSQGRLCRSKMMSEKLRDAGQSEGKRLQACGFREVVICCDKVKGVSLGAG